VIEAPDHERVAGTQVVQACVQLRAVLQRARADVLVHARTSGLVQRVQLQREVLLIGGHARVADQLARDPRCMACSVHAEHRLITPGRLQVATHTAMRQVVTGFETRVARLTAAVVERVDFETSLHEPRPLSTGPPHLGVLTRSLGCHLARTCARVEASGGSV
jgi:hypothetical protein